MSERGVFAVDRGVFDHPIFAPEPFTEVMAWLWLISAACWQAKRVRVGKAMVDLERGQLAFSTRFMAVKWKWSESRVRRFLKRLETDAMLTTHATHSSTVITLCNYDKYSFGRRTDDVGTDALTDEPPTQQRRKEEELKKEKKEEIKEEVARKRAETRRATRLPADAVPSQQNIDDALAAGVPRTEIMGQWERMRDWSQSSPKGACLNWDSRWRNWVKDFRPRASSGRGPPSPSFAEIHSQLSASLNEPVHDSPSIQGDHQSTFDLVLTASRDG